MKTNMIVNCNAQMNTLVDQDIVKQSYLSVKLYLVT